MNKSSEGEKEIAINNVETILKNQNIYYISDNSELNYKGRRPDLCSIRSRI